MRNYQDQVKPVVEFNDKEILIRFYGYKVGTLKRKINKESERHNLGFKVFRKDREWHLLTGKLHYSMIGAVLVIPR